jgi:hypothetical protein
MCAESVAASRLARAGDKLITTILANSTARGLAAVGEPNVAIRLLPGTEVAFAKDVEYKRPFGLPIGRLKERVAQFLSIDEDASNVNHDAFDFPSGHTILLTRLCAASISPSSSCRPVGARSR